MTALQLGLIVAGVLLVIAVIVYNVWQERRLKRSLASGTAADGAAAEARRSATRVEPTLRAEPVHTAPPADVPPAVRATEARESSFELPVEVIPPPVTFDEPDVVAEDGAAAPVLADAARIQAASDSSGIDAARSTAPPAHEIARKVAQPDHEIECLIPLTPAAPIVAGALASGLHARIGKPLRWFGRVDARSDWQPLSSDTPGRFADVVACMLLADRNGAASRAQLETFARVVGEVASAVAATCAPPDLAHEAARAESLDRLCAELDVQIGLTVQMPDPASIAGTRLRGVAEAAGFRLSPAGRFEFINEDTGAVLYTLQNLRPDTFSAEMLRLTATNGVVFLLDVARLADPPRTFDQMKLAARRMAGTLGAELVDDNRRPLDDAALTTIRGQVTAATDALRAVHIEPGSARALALFSA